MNPILRHYNQEHSKRKIKISNQVDLREPTMPIISYTDSESNECKQFS
jgi:hypothetical protein